MRKILLSIALSLWFFPSFSQNNYFPNVQWEIKKPEEMKMNPTVLDSAIRFAQQNEIKIDSDLRVAILKSYQEEPDYRILGPTKPRSEPAGLIIRKGYIVAQWGDLKRADMVFSVTKSFLSVVAGLAFDQGLIQNVQEKVSEYCQEYHFEGVHNSKITWEHLLQQTSDWSGCQFDICDWADRPPKEGGLDEWRNRTLLEPGSKFEYNDVRVNLLSYCLLQVWRQPLPIVLKEKIMDPIGASSTWRWHGYDNSFVNIDGLMVQSVSGGGHFGGGMMINALDQARFGLLILRNGQWKGQQLLSSQWISNSIKPCNVYPSYGYLWWLNEENTLKGLSKNIFYAAGYGGNYIIMDRENDLLMVVKWLDNTKLSDFVNLVEKSLSDKK